MSLLGFKGKNHPQQVEKDGARREGDDRATDPAVFAGFNERFHFTIDVAASVENKKCRRFHSEKTNGLARSWAGERVWCNPPYSDIKSWVEKAWAEWNRGEVELIVMLLPANRTEQGWWQDLVEPSLRVQVSDFKCEFLRGRMRFIKRGKTEVGPNERPPFGVCLLIWGE